MRYRLVAITLPGAMVAGMLLPSKLWLTDRYYSQAPVWGARRVYRGIACRLGPLQAVILEIQEAPDWRTRKRLTTREILQE